MSPVKWKHFDHWWVKTVAFILIIGSVWWMTYAIRDHYHLEHLTHKQVEWEWLPFIMGSLFIIFCLAILSKSLTSGAASVVLPFAQLVIEKLTGAKGNDQVAMKVTPPAPGQPAAGTVTVTTDDHAIPDRGDKP